MDSDDPEKRAKTLDSVLYRPVAPPLCRNRHDRVNRKATRRMVRYGLHLVNSLSKASPGAICMDRSSPIWRRSRPLYSVVLIEDKHIDRQFQTPILYTPWGSLRTMTRVNEITSVANVQPIFRHGPQLPVTRSYAANRLPTPPPGGILISNDANHRINLIIRTELR